MAVKLSVSESKFLERVRTALVNVESHPEIKAVMADFGMDESELSYGRGLYDQTRAVKELSEREKVESRLSVNAYKQAYRDFRAAFVQHREFVQVYYKRDEQLLTKLRLTERLPQKYNEIFDRARSFYTVAQTDPAVGEQLTRVRVTPEVVAESLSKLDDLLSARSHFDRETGESQHATQAKKEVMKKLKEWLEQFDATAKVALYDKPQLMEALGIFVRS